MSNELTINFTRDEVDALEYMITLVLEKRSDPKDEKEKETNEFLNRMLIKIAKVKFEYLVAHPEI